MGFINSFLSYLLLMLVFAAAAALAIAAGIVMRKRKDAQSLDTMQADSES